MLISGDNSYEGLTDIRNGVLEIAGSMASASDIRVRRRGHLVLNSEIANFINLERGSRVSGAGTLNNDLVAKGATLAPGNSPGTLTVNSLLLDSQSELEFELADPSVIGGEVNDLIVVRGTLVLDGLLKIVGLPGFDSGDYRLFNYAGRLIDNGLEIDVDSAPPGHRYTLLTDIPGQVTLHVNPEPGTLALLLAGTGVLLRRRRNAS